VASKQRPNLFKHNLRNLEADILKQQTRQIVTIIYGQEVKGKGERDISGYISKGDENWLSFQKARPEHKGEGSN
jgi:hypothetical protein